MTFVDSCDTDGGTFHLILSDFVIGSLETFNQTVYECNNIRGILIHILNILNLVNEEGYNLYTINPEYTCTETEYTDRRGCWCKKDRFGDQCEYVTSTECIFHLKAPDFTEPCRLQDYDSAFYSYSNPGYDPCHWVGKLSIHTQKLL